MDVQPQRCRVCGHLDVFPTSRCSSCGYLRSPLSLFGMIEADMPPGKKESKNKDKRRRRKNGAEPRSLSSDDSSRSEDDDDKALLDAAFKSVERLFERVRSEGGSLSDAERADLYESLLLSLMPLCLRMSSTHQVKNKSSDCEVLSHFMMLSYFNIVHLLVSGRISPMFSFMLANDPPC